MSEVRTEFENSLVWTCAICLDAMQSRIGGHLNQAAGWLRVKKRKMYVRIGLSPGVLRRSRNRDKSQLVDTHNGNAKAT